jgi:myo-inositol 2-dehydrogenase/D-chiro-inositol 1-dehydrogenase
MARWVPAAEAMAFLSRKTGAHLQVGFVRRFDDEWLAFRETIQAGKIGKPVVWQDIQSHAGPAAAWYCQDEIGGGPFLDGAIHTIDFALYTFGPAEWVFANARSFREASTALDTGSATIRFQSGDELLLAWSWGLPKGCSGQRIFQLLGPSGTVRWNGVPAGSKTGSFVVHQGDRQEEVAYPANALMKGYERQIDEFLAVARGEAQPRAGSREGVDALRVANAIIQSGRTASVIRL